MKKMADTRIAKTIKNIFNVRKWSDYDRVKSFTFYLWSGFRRLFVPQQPTVSNESFKAAVKEYQLTDKELIAKQNALYRLSILMLTLAILILAYASYQAIYGSFHAMILSIVVMIVALTLGFRYHFWYFQIKKRKLGCTFKEWFRQGLMGDKNV